MKTFFKRYMEWYFGVQPAESGQGTAWSYEYHSPWPVWLPDWCVLLLCISLISFVVLIYWRDAVSASVWVRAQFIALRLSLIGLALICLSELTLSIDLTGLPTVVILLDESASMNLEDQYEGDDLHRISRLTNNSAEIHSRLDLAKSLLSNEGGQFIKKLLRKHKLRLYRFSDITIPIGKRSTTAETETQELLAAIENIRPEGKQTRPGPAIQKVLNEMRGMPPAAIIVLTDGITTTNASESLTAVSELARAQLVPVYTVGIGSSEPARDLQLYDMLADEVAFVNDPITFSARVRAFGFRGEQVTIHLKDESSRKILASEEVEISTDGDPIKIEIPYTPTSKGEFNFQLEIASKPKELNLQNNTQSRHVSVRQEKIQVLLADGYPRYEFRFLQHLLEREKTIELDTVLQDADLEYAVEDQTALEHFPIKREELFKYDVIIMGDVNPDSLGDTILENLRDFVQETGGGLISIAGMSHNPHAYRNTPLSVVFPVELSRVKQSDPEELITESFRPHLTIEGRKGTAIFRFAETEQKSARIWQQLPELYWLLSCPELKPGAMVLAEHPSRNGASRKLPVIAMQRFGAGKVIFHATDELWRWRFRRGDLYYGRYWIQSIRFLSRSRLLGTDRTAELTAEQAIYQQGDSARLRVRILNDRITPAQNEDVEVMLEGKQTLQQIVKLSRLPDARNIFEGETGRLNVDDYHAWVVKPLFGKSPPVVDFRVEAPQQELKIRRLNRKEMKSISQRTHGQYFSIGKASNLPDVLPAGNPVPLQARTPHSVVEPVGNDDSLCLSAYVRMVIEKTATTAMM